MSTEKILDKVKKMLAIANEEFIKAQGTKIVVQKPRDSDITDYSAYSAGSRHGAKIDLSLQVGEASSSPLMIGK